LLLIPAKFLIRAVVSLLSFITFSIQMITLLCIKHYTSERGV
jgi:hypothetical protein